MAKAPDSKRIPGEDTVDRLADLLLRFEAFLDNAIVEGVKSGRLQEQSYLKAHLSVITAALTAMEEQADPLIRQSITEAYTGKKLEIEDFVKAAGFKWRARFDSPTDERILSVLIDNVVASFGAALHSIGRTVDDIFRQVALREVTLGQLRGDPGSVADNMEAAFEEAGVTFTQSEDLKRAGYPTNGYPGARVVKLNGRNYRVGPYCEMVARTTTREAASYGLIVGMDELDMDLVTISSHSHEGMSDQEYMDKDVCAPFEGKTFSLSGLDDFYPKLKVMPPFHPRCIHVLTPADENLKGLKDSKPLMDAQEKQLELPVKS